MSSPGQELIDKLETYIVQEKKAKITNFLAELYPADIADLLDQLNEEELQIVVPCLPLQKIAVSIQELEFSSRRLLLKFLGPSELKTVLNNMYADDTADLLGSLSIGQSKQLLDLMRREEARQIQDLLGYDQESAGGIMTTEYIAIRQDLTAQQALDKIREIATEAEMIYYIYIVDKTQKLVGVLSMRELITAPPAAVLDKLMHRKVINVLLNKDQEEVAQMISKYDLLAMPVVNDRGQLLGIITVDDIIDVIEEEATEDIYKLSAAPEVDLDSRPIIKGAFKRLPWLTLLLFASMLSGTVIGSFSESLSSVVALAFFIPTLTGTGGNAGTQSLAVVVRGLGTGDLSSQDIGRHLWNEFRVGSLTALICGIIIALVAFFWQGNYILGVVVGVAMICTILVATLLGTTIPFVISYFGADPAVAAGPFITTLVDVSGLFIYFSLAKLLLYYLT